MIKEILFGKRMVSIVKSVDNILQKMAEANPEQLVEIYKITAESIRDVLTTTLTPENLEVIVKAFLAYNLRKEKVSAD